VRAYLAERIPLNPKGGN